MKSFLITYDLIRTGQAYEPLKEKIISINPKGYWKCMESVFIVNTDLTALEIGKLLDPLIDSNDKILIAELTGNLAFDGFAGDCETWLHNYLIRV